MNPAIKRPVITEGLFSWKQAKNILFIASIAFLVSMAAGCACKAIAPQLSKNVEQIDRNADYFLEKAKAGEVASIDVVESHKKLTATTKDLAEAGNE